MKVGSTILQIGHITFAREIKNMIEVNVSGQRVPYVSRADEAAAIKSSLEQAGFVKSDINWINPLMIAAVEIVGDIARVRFLGSDSPMILHSKLAEPVIEKIQGWEDARLVYPEPEVVPAPEPAPNGKPKKARKS